MTNNKPSNAQLHAEIENIPSNKSSNKPFSSILEASLSRRNVLSGSLAFAATALFASPSSALTSEKKQNKNNTQKELVGFNPVSVSDITDSKMPTISDDYEYDVIIPWGTPIEPGATKEYTGDPLSRPSAKEASLQIGLGHDGMWFFPIDQQRYASLTDRGYQLSSSEGMLCINHEYNINSHALGKEVPEDINDVRLSQNTHGVSVLKLQKNSLTNRWQVSSSQASRRITVNTPVEFSGPAAASDLLKNPTDTPALGTLNNCGCGVTPWGTYLTCEENFNGYFGATKEHVNSEALNRYGFSRNGFDYHWHEFDKRFDLSDKHYVNESNRFGWVVEIDPFDSTKKPVKRTALGRFKHESVAMVESKNGRIAAYMGDDQHFDYCYKYVSHKPWKTAMENNESPLDSGSLFVAKFNDNGTGEWLELTIDNPKLAKHFKSQAEILIYARLAADLLGATPMDRPEWATPGINSEIYWACTNNTKRKKTNAANSEVGNSDGHIIKTIDSSNYLGNTFTWEAFLLASNTRGTEAEFTNPDSLWADKQGRLFIGTDGDQPNGLQNQLVVIDTTKEAPIPKRFLVGVNGDEITGFAITPDQRTAFVNIQHPGNGSPKETNFPRAFDGKTIPRDATLVIRRKDGGIIGS
ncbi:MAG: PhoX family phosphatase [Cellvibrionaceae bacterium]